MHGDNGALEREHVAREMERLLRAEAGQRAAEKAQELLDGYRPLMDLDDGAVIYFSRTVPSRVKPDFPVTLHYAAVRSGDRWYMTGRTTVHGASDAELVAYLARLGVAATDVETWTG